MKPAALNGAGDAMWTNLGFWPATPAAEDDAENDYVRAAGELARRVGRAAALRAGDVVVDYACGYGDSLRLWVEEFGVQRVVGVEPDPDVCRVVASRIHRWDLEDRIRVHCARAEELAPTDAARDVTAVVSVDAAYHFRTRARWLQRCAASLPAGARIAFSDLLWTASQDAGLVTAALARGMGIDPANLVDESALRREVEGAGFEQVVIERYGRDVLDGFAVAELNGSPAASITQWIIRRLRTAGRVDYALSAAIQPIAPRSAMRG